MPVQSNRQHVWNHDNQNDLVPCPECHSWMLPLKDYDMSSAGETPGVGAELWEFLLWGWMAFVYNYIYDLMTMKSRKTRLAQLKQEVLPQFPNSLVCPEGLHVIKKR